MSEIAKNYLQREKKSISMGDGKEDVAKAFFKRSEELQITMSETLEEMAQLLRSLNQKQSINMPAYDKGKGQLNQTNEMD